MERLADREEFEDLRKIHPVALHVVGVAFFGHAEVSRAGISFVTDRRQGQGQELGGIAMGISANRSPRS